MTILSVSGAAKKIAPQLCPCSTPMFCAWAVRQRRQRTQAMRKRGKPRAQRVCGETTISQASANPPTFECLGKGSCKRAPFPWLLMVSSQTKNRMERRTDNTMYSINFMGQTITCETAGEVVDLVHEIGRAATKPTTMPTTTRATTTGKKSKKKPTKKTTLKARAAQARESYKAKQEASRQAHKQEAAEAEAISTAKEVVTTAETHHGPPTAVPAAAPKPKRADTSAAVIGTLRRSGLPLTISEIQDDLQKAGWKYRGTDPKGTIRATLGRLVGKDEVGKGRRNGDITFTIAKVEHADPLPHEQREVD